MKKKLLLFCSVMLILIGTSFSQQLELRNTFIINGGDFSNPDDKVTVMMYNHQMGRMMTVDSIGTKSTQGALMDEKILYVCAQDSLVSYDLATHKRKAAVKITGLNKIKVYNNYLILTLQFPVTSESLLILDKNTLEIKKTITMPGECSGIAIVNDQAYVAVPGAWNNEVGIISIIDMATLEIKKHIALGTEAAGIRDIIHFEGKIYTFNSLFNTSDLPADHNFSITTLNTWDEQFTTKTFNGNRLAFSALPVLVNNLIYIPLSTGIATLNTSTSELNTTVIDLVPLAIAYDKIGKNFHMTLAPNYGEPGRYSIIDMNGNTVLEPVDTKIAPEAIALDYNVINPFTFENVTFWVGSGENKALFIVDWNDSTATQSMAWGYRFDGDIAAEKMLIDIANADPSLSINIGGGFLNDIIYIREGDTDSETISHTGISGNPAFWYTWSRTNTTDWDMNFGIGTPVPNGGSFGCSYSVYGYPTEPKIPVAAQTTDAIETISNDLFTAYYSAPNLIIESETNISNISIFSITGKLLKHIPQNYQSRATINIEHLEKGIYIILCEKNNIRYNKKVLVF